MSPFRMDEINITNIINNDYMKRAIRNLLPSLKRVQNEIFKICNNEKAANGLFKYLGQTLFFRKNEGPGSRLMSKPLWVLNFPANSKGVAIYPYLIPKDAKGGHFGHFNVSSEGPYIALGLFCNYGQEGTRGKVIWNDSYIEVLNHEVYHLLQTASLAYRSLSIRYHNLNPSGEEFRDEICRVYSHGSKGGGYDFQLLNDETKSDEERLPAAKDYFRNKGEIGAIAGSLMRKIMHDSSLTQENKQVMIRDWENSLGMNWARRKSKPLYSLYQWAYNIGKKYDSTQLAALFSFMETEMKVDRIRRENTKGYALLEDLFRAMILEYRRMYRR